jgi:hypothetical protein
MVHRRLHEISWGAAASGFSGFRLWNMTHFVLISRFVWDLVLAATECTVACIHMQDSVLGTERPCVCVCDKPASMPGF